VTDEHGVFLLVIDEYFEVALLFLTTALKEDVISL